MTRKLYHLSFTVPILLVTVLLQACGAASTLNMQPQELKERPPMLELPSSNKKGDKKSYQQQPEAKRITLTHASQPEVKSKSPKPPSSAPLDRHPPTQTTAASGGPKSASVPVIKKQPPSGDNRVFNPYGSSTGDAQELLQSTKQAKGKLDIEALLTELKGLTSRDMALWPDCLNKIVKIVSPDSVVEVQQALGEASNKLTKASQDVKQPQKVVIDKTRKLIQTIQKDLTDLQAILRGEVPIPPFLQSFCCGCCCGETPKLNRIKTGYPCMQPAVYEALEKAKKNISSALRDMV